MHAHRRRLSSLLTRTLVGLVAVLVLLQLFYVDVINNNNNNGNNDDNNNNNNNNNNRINSVITSEHYQDSAESNADSSPEIRAERLQRTCAKFSDRQRPESVALNGGGGGERRPETSAGVEVVHLQGRTKVASVCIPHKVGSHAWGKFAKFFNQNATSSSSSPRGRQLEDFLKLDFKTRSLSSLRVVVVRHPLERLVSVYRMIFEDWCDRKRWLAKQWSGRVCRDQVFETNGDEETSDDKFIQKEYKNKERFLRDMFDEYKNGNDRFMAKVWRKYNPDQTLSPDNFKFSFVQFARLVVNGSLDFRNDEYVLNHKGLSYHWAPFWQECPLCSPLTSPHLVIRLETLNSDLRVLLEKLGVDDVTGAAAVDDVIGAFPHTHAHHTGGSSSNNELLRGYYSTLTRHQVIQLYEKYRLDHQLFGYSPTQFIQYAKS